MFIILGWFVLAIIIGAAAGSRGRSGFGWFVLAIVISPIIAGLLLAIFPDLRMQGLLEKMATASRVDDRELARATELPVVYGKTPSMIGPTIIAVTVAAIVALIVAYYSVDEPQRTALVAWVSHITAK